MCHDASHTDEQAVGPEIDELIHQPLGIERGVRRAEVGLDPADRLDHPPTRARLLCGLGRRGTQQAGGRKLEELSTLEMHRASPG
jgi:hypothetical protein